MKSKTSESKSGILSYDKWSIYFDLEDQEILQRLERLINKENMSIIDLISIKPDLYVPLWGSFILIIFIFIFGNIKSLLLNHLFSYDLLPKSASLIFGYLFLSPIFFYLLGKFNEININILQILVLIGYSMLFYIPSIILSAIPIFFISLIIFFFSFISSSYFLIQNLKTYI